MKHVDDEYSKLDWKPHKTTFHVPSRVWNLSSADTCMAANESSTSDELPRIFSDESAGDIKSLQALAPTEAPSLIEPESASPEEVCGLFCAICNEMFF